MLKHKLSDIASVSVSSVDKKRSGEEKDVHLCNYTDVYRNWAITSQIKSSFLSATATDAEISKFSLKKGQVVITKDSETSGDIGISAYVAEEFENTLLGYHCALITPKTEICNGAYLNAFLNSSTAREYFKNNASGSGQRFSLSTRALQETPIYLPTLKIQKIVGNFFSAIDRKISLNNEINRNLEAMARQLYDYWFVQFDFPDENGRPYKSSGGRMVWNEKLKRDIPEQWEVINLFDAIDVQYGFPFSTELLVDDVTNTPVVRIRDILNGTVSAYSTEETDSKYRLSRGDVLIGMDGNFHMNLWCDNQAYLNQRSVRFRQIGGSPISALQVMFEVAPYIKAKEQNAKGSTVGHLSDKDLRGLWILKPFTHLHFSPEKTLNQIADLIVENRIEVSNLTTQRDELLPLLMNGQASVIPTEVNCDLSHC